MHPRSPILFSRWEVPFFFFLLISGVAILLAVAGCQSSGDNGPAQTSAKPNFGPPMQDVRTEGTIVEMENEYTAAKNSQPTHHAEAQAEAAKKKQEQEKKAKEKAAEDAAKTSPEPAK